MINDSSIDCNFISATSAAGSADIFVAADLLLKSLHTIVVVMKITFM